MLKHFAILLFVPLAVVPALAQAPKAAKVTFDDHVLPILREKCSSCHNQDKSRGGLVVMTYTALMAGGSSGEVVKPGDADNSRLFQLTAHKAEPKMPPKSDRLPDAQLETLRKWIDGGALENAGSKARVVNKPKYEMALSSINKGKPTGPPPMPSPRLGLEPIVRTAKANAITALAASPWAPLVAVGGQKQVLLYHSDTLELLGVLAFPEGVPNVLKFSRNGSLLLAGGGHGAKQGKVVVWNVTSGERIFTVGDETDAVLAADISADQSQIALGGPSKILRVYSTRDGQLLREVKKHTDWIYTIEYSPDGVLLASGDRSGGLYVWEAHTGREYLSLRAHTAAITDVSWRLDGNILASASLDTTIRLWEMENGGNIKGWGAHGGGVESVRFARDGRLVSAGRDRVVKVWDQNGAQQKAYGGLPDVALRAVFSHDAARVVAGDWSGQIRVWATADAKDVGQLVANPAPVAERLTALTNEVATREQAQPGLAAAAAASATAAQKAAQELANMQQLLAATPLGVQAANATLAQAQAAAQQANAALAAAQSQAAARDLLANSLAEAAAKVKAAADKAKDNKDLAAAAAHAQQLAAQAANERAAAQKAVTDRTAGVKAANDQLAKAQQTAAAANTAGTRAKQLLDGLQATATTTAARAAADRTAADQNAAALTAARAQLNRLKNLPITARAGSK